MLEELKTQVTRWNQELPRNGLVAWTSGNVSGRDPASGLVVMKPSGVRYEDMRPEHMVVLDLAGKIVEGTLSPRSIRPATSISIGPDKMWVPLCILIRGMPRRSPPPAGPFRAC